MWWFFFPTPVLSGYFKKTTSVCSMFLCCDYLQKWWMIFIVKISVVLLQLFFSNFLSSFVGYMLYFNKPRGFCPLSFVGSFLWFFFVRDMKWYVFQKQFVRKANSNSKVLETDFGGGQWRLLTGAKWAVKRQAVPQNPYCFQPCTNAIHLRFEWTQQLHDFSIIFHIPELSCFGDVLSLVGVDPIALAELLREFGEMEVLFQSRKTFLDLFEIERTYSILRKCSMMFDSWTGTSTGSGVQQDVEWSISDIYWKSGWESLPAFLGSSDECWQCLRMDGRYGTSTGWYQETMSHKSLASKHR